MEIKTRFEIEVRTLKSGRLYLLAYDEYWNGTSHAFLDPNTLEFTPNSDSQITWAFSELKQELAKLKPGCWYSLRVTCKPGTGHGWAFIKPTQMVRIPGRHQVYRGDPLASRR